jgi:glycosyltransferase involved in cell wall biosynthesis
MNFAFVLLTHHVFGGAERRFFNLFFYLRSQKKNNFYLIIPHSLYEKAKEVYPDMEMSNVIPVGTRVASDHIKASHVKGDEGKINKAYSLIRIIKRTFFYKYYFLFKNCIPQKRLFREIDHYRLECNIQGFIGIFNGIIPLYFYLDRKSTEVPGIIFCNMDSWFSSISNNQKRDWYRKYSLLNYAHEKADYVDFLSPFILKGIRARGITIPDERAKITACSFTDYSKCRIGEKEKFGIAFAGRLEKDKNPLLFLDAALLLSKEYPDAVFHIMGEGRLSGTVSETVKNSGLLNIIFHGFHPSPTEIFAGTSVFVSIQSTNNYPSQSVLEAMACGNAIIATDVGDTRMFVNDENGTLIPLDKDSLVEAIRFYLDNPGKAKEKGAFAARYVRENFTIEKAAAYYLDLFEKSVHNPKPHPLTPPLQGEGQGKGS